VALRGDCSLTIRCCSRERSVAETLFSRGESLSRRKSLEPLDARTNLALGWMVSLARAGDRNQALGGKCGQATKGARWMFWRQEAMKDVAWLR
jgi:hypothetical protein